MGRAKSEAEAKYAKGAVVPRAVLDAALAPLESEMKNEAAAVAASFDSSVALLLEAFDKVPLFFWGFCVSFAFSTAGEGACGNSVGGQFACGGDGGGGVVGHSRPAGAAALGLGARGARTGERQMQE